MIKYLCKFRLVLRCLLVARNENLTSVSTFLTGRSKSLDPTGNPTARLTRPVPVDQTGFHFWCDGLFLFKFFSSAYGQRSSNNGNEQVSQLPSTVHCFWNRLSSGVRCASNQNFVKKNFTPKTLLIKGLNQTVKIFSFEKFLSWAAC